ncbi:MAG: ADP-glyceromanno-heptose 6-epimerase [Gammaproteobacteria bacterium]
MIVVTGGAGFIGSNLVHAFNSQLNEEILVVDDLTDGAKFRNLIGSNISDYWDKDELLERLPTLKPLRAVFHLGACTNTTEWDGRYMMQNNYTYSRRLLDLCTAQGIPFIYASSAAVYGRGADFREDAAPMQPLNIYGYSKLLFDQYVLRRLSGLQSQVVGLRYFNVYGPREQHKGPMASVTYHFYCQLLESGQVRLFEGSDGYGNGEQRRDFVFVDDVVAVNLWFLSNPDKSGIFNLGTGRSQSFNELANAVIAHQGRGHIEYIPFPRKLLGCYQSYTQADISALREAGYTGEFRTVEQGVASYMRWLCTQHTA